MTQPYIWLTIVIFLLAVLGRVFDKDLPPCDARCKYVSLILNVAMIVWGLMLVLL